MTASHSNLLKQDKVTDKLQSNNVNMDTKEGRGRRSVRINRLSVQSGLNLEKMQRLSFTWGNATGQ